MKTKGFLLSIASAALLLLMAVPTSVIAQDPPPPAPAPTPATEPPSAPALSVPPTAPPTGTTDVKKWIIWGVLLFVLFLIQALIAVFVGIDGRKRSVSSYLVWAILAIIPVLGILGLFAYLIITMSGGKGTKEEQEEMIARAVNAGVEKGKKMMQGHIDDLQAELERVKANIPELPNIDEEEVTQIIQNTRGDSGIMLLHMGGDRDGHPEQLNIRNPVTGAAKKVRIGKNSDGTEIALPWDNKVSRVHCEISFDHDNGGENYYVYDLNSTNGVLLRREGEDFRKIDGKAYIRDGDVLKIGESQFRVVVFRPITVEKVVAGADSPHTSAFAPELPAASGPPPPPPNPPVT